LGKLGRSIPIDARDDALAPRTPGGVRTGAEGTAIAMANVLAASRRTDQAKAARVSRRERVVGNLILTPHSSARLMRFLIG
jgi:hypothetical protein